MRPSSSSWSLPAAAVVLLLLAIRGANGAVPRPPAEAPVMLPGTARTTSFGDVAKGAVEMSRGERQLAGADDEDQDYGYVDPPPDTNRRGAGAPIPHK
jgi:hypothetical protein